MYKKILLFIKILITLAIWMYGLYIIIYYKINLFQSAIEELDYLQKLFAIINANDTFLKILENNWVFKIIIVDWEERAYMLLALSLIVHSYLSDFYGMILKYKICDDSVAVCYIYKTIKCLTDFFLIFIANKILVTIFELLAKIDVVTLHIKIAVLCEYVEDLFNKYFDENTIFIPIILGIIFIKFIWDNQSDITGIIFNLTTGRIVLPLFDLMILTIVYSVIFFIGIRSIPVVISIIITISTKYLFRKWLIYRYG